jgi:hypothetical protein
MTLPKRTADNVITELEFMLPRVPDGDTETTISNADVALIVAGYRNLQGKIFDETSADDRIFQALVDADQLRKTEEVAEKEASE